MQIVEYAKAHPWATGIVVVIGGIVFISISGIFDGGGGSGGATASGPSDAEIAANATVMAAQISAQASAAMAGAQLQATQIGAGVQINSDNLAAQVAMEQYRVAESIGLKQIESDTTLGVHSIDAQRDMFVVNSNNQVATQNIIANASKSKNKSNNITSLLSGIAGGIFSIFSDVRLKENVHIIGRSEEGYGLYSFNFKGSDTVRHGVIAQEVIKYRPDLVTEDRSGYLKVDTLRLPGFFAVEHGGPLVESIT